MKVAIVDDMGEMLDIIHSYVENTKKIFIVKCDCFQKPQYLLNKIKNGQKYDLYFLDIKMEEINGLELAKEIKSLQNSAYIVFVTFYEKYAMEGYNNKIRAYQYILKNQMQEKIPKIIEEIFYEIQNNREEYYVIQNKLRYEKFKLLDIIYIYKDGKNSVFITNEGEFKERNSLKNVINNLKKPEFLFMDSGRIINIKYIQKVEGNSICLLDGTKFYVSRSNIRKIKKGISNYWRNIDGNYL